MRRVKLVGRVIGISLTVILAVLLGCNLYRIAVRTVTGERMPAVFGYSTAVVISGSMSGYVEVNDMVVIHGQKSYSVGDVITFERRDSIVTHRIVGETDEGFITKGDANNAVDEDVVSMDQVVGRVILVIPKIGAIMEALRTPLGRMCLVLMGFMLVEIPVVREYFLARKQRGGSGDDEHWQEKQN